MVAANRVVAATPAARAEGVRPGMRRREAQGRCPEATVVGADAGRDARAWEPAVAALEGLAPGVQVLEAGAVAVATRGPSRYFGGDEALGALTATTVDRAVGGTAGGTAGWGCRVGVADGRFAAALAAHAAHLDGREVVVVPGGCSRAWLAPQPVGALGLGYEDLTDLLVRLGIRTLGALAALPAPSVLGRFGPEGAAAHRLARGLDERPLVARTPPPDLAVTAELDPPEPRVEAAAFVAKALADELQARLEGAGLACTLVAIEAETEHGESLVRRWRHEGALTAAGLSERARWQLDGWLAGDGEGRPSGGLTLLRLTPEEVRPDEGRQLGFWGGSADFEARTARALARVQGLLGPEAVVTAVLQGGRGFSDQVRLVPWGDARTPEGGTGSREMPPWPGRLAQPSPAVVHPEPVAAEVRDATGHPVTVSGRGALSAAPAAVSVAGGPWTAVAAWAGPWPLEERWWDGGGRRRARLQILLDGGQAHLLSREAGLWWVEATYS